MKRERKFYRFRCDGCQAEVSEAEGLELPDGWVATFNRHMPAVQHFHSEECLREWWAKQQPQPERGALWAIEDEAARR